MKKILQIDIDEKERILEMHKNAIRKNFLGEQTAPAAAPAPATTQTTATTPTTPQTTASNVPQPKVDVEVINDPTLALIQTKLSQLNTITNSDKMKDFKSEYRVEAKEKSNRLTLFRFYENSQKGTDLITIYFGGGDNAPNFNVGTNLSNEGLSNNQYAKNNLETIKKLILEIINDIKTFAQKFRRDDIIKTWAGNTKIINTASKPTT